MLIWSEEVQRDNRRRKLVDRLNTVLSNTVNIGHGERNRDLEGKTDSEIERTGEMKMKRGLAVSIVLLILCPPV